MKINKTAANFGLYTFGIILSCGPSQIYGLVKVVVDLVKYASICSKISKLKAKEGYSLRRMSDLTVAKNRKSLSLKADLVAMAPVIGALFSWRVLAPKGNRFNLDARKGVPFAIAHAVADFSHIFQRLLYPLSSSKEQAGYAKIDAIMQQVKAGRKAFKQFHATAPKPIKEVVPIQKVQIPVDIRPETPGQPSHIEAVEMIHADQKERATVVVSHGNGMIGKDMTSIGKFYFRLGFNVLLPTMGGYPGTSPCTTSETTSLQDVEAIKKYLISKNREKVAYHGLSIGGTVAFQASAASTKTNEQIKTLFVVADQTFTSAKDVFANTIRNKTNLKIGSIAKGGGLAAVPPGERVQVSEDEWVCTDGLDNLAKAKKLKEKGIALITIEASRDELMKNLKDPNYKKGHFAARLLAARYDTPEERASHLIQLEGGHRSMISKQPFAAQQEKLKALISGFVP
jgi:hypothetical protein